MAPVPQPHAAVWTVYSLKSVPILVQFCGTDRKRALAPRCGQPTTSPPPSDHRRKRHEQGQQFLLLIQCLIRGMAWCAIHIDYYYYYSGQHTMQNSAPNIEWLRALTVDNFRVISTGLSPVISKLFEHAVSDHFLHHLTTSGNQTLSSQSGVIIITITITKIIY